MLLRIAVDISEKFYQALYRILYLGRIKHLLILTSCVACCPRVSKCEGECRRCVKSFAVNVGGDLVKEVWQQT